MKVKPTLCQRIRQSFLIVPLIIATTVPAVTAASVTVSWDPNVPSPQGYRVFARKIDQAYDYNRPDWEGAAASCTLDNLEGQTEYYFVIRAYDGSLENSDSSEAHYIPPVTDNDGDGTYSWRVRFFDSGGRASAWSARANFTTQAADDDLDGNGISDDQEGGVGQAHVTRSLSSPTITCEPTDLVVASETIVAEIEQVALIDPNDLEIDETTPDRLPSAMLAYKLVLHRPGQRALVTIKLSDPAPAGATWIKYDAVR